jgi:alanine racemase
MSSVKNKPQLYINLDNLRDNYLHLKEHCGAHTDVACVVKSNAYGVGALETSATLYKAGCRKFFVATLEEAISLRELFDRLLSKPTEPSIYALYGPDHLNLEFFTQKQITPVINSLHQLDIWQNHSKKLNTILNYVLHIDTGMHRLGMPLYELESFLNKKDDYSGINLEFVMSHLASSEMIDDHQNSTQLEKFILYTEQLRTKKSLANSGGIFLDKKYHFDIVRPGAALYGIKHNQHFSKIKDVVSLYAPIIQLQKICKDETIGYNASWTAQRDTIIATLPVGYGDGYLRHLSNNGVVLVNNIPSKVVGRVSMDLITVDVTDVPAENLFIGQLAEIIGPQISLSQIARLSSTAEYEILTNLGNRYDRQYITIN